MMRLYLSKRTHVLLITILFFSQLLASSPYNIYVLTATTVISSIILLFYLSYARVHHSVKEIYALFQLLSLTIVSGTMTSLFLQAILGQVSLFTTLYSITLVLTVSVVVITICNMYKRIER